jgi:hypothetical protein
MTKLMFVGTKTVIFTRQRQGLCVKCYNLQDTFLKLTNLLIWSEWVSRWDLVNLLVLTL